MPDSKQNEILDLLRSYPAGNIYTLAPREYVHRGFDYFRKERVVDFTWTEDGAALTAIVKGSTFYSVIFSADRKGLSFSCDCPAWSPSTQCKHVICSLLTIKSLFHPASFNKTYRDESLREYLLAALKRENPPDATAGTVPSYAIVVVKDSGIRDVYIAKSGVRVRGPLYSHPRELHQFISSPYWAPYFRARQLAAYLKEYGNKFPLILQTGDTQWDLKYEESLSYSCKTGIELSGDVARIDKLFFYNGIPAEKVSYCDDFIFDTDANRLGRLKNKSGLRIWNELNCLHHELSPTSVPPDDDKKFFQMPAVKLQEYILAFPSSDGSKPKDLMLTYGGNEIQPETRDASYRLTITKGTRRDRNKFIVSAECSVDKISFSPAPNVFNFFAALENQVPAPLRALKRKAVLIRAFFNMLSAGPVTKGDGVIKEALSGEDFSKRIIKHSARDLLKQYLTAFHLDEKLLLFQDLKWVTADVDKQRESLLYQIPYEIFGWEIFRGLPGYDRMAVLQEDLYDKLPILYEMGKAHAVELYFESKVVQTSEWDFTFDADRPTGIDWFEIRPEIRCNGELIDDATFREMLSKKGILEKNNFIRIMDSNSRRIFETVSGILHAGDYGKGKGKEIVRVPRLQILDWIALRNIGVKVKLSPEDEAIIERLTAFEKIEQKPLPEKLKAKLRHYQRDGYAWLAFLYEHKFGACLADDMGLGKTVQAISFLAGIKEGRISSPPEVKALPHLIVMPPSLLFNWENEINKFCPDLRIRFYTGADRSRNFAGCDAVLTTYTLVRRDIEELKKLRFNVVIFDEAQAVKNIYAETTGAVRQINAYFKLTMTGTPLENHVGEYYSLIDLSVPGLLGDYEKFRPLIKQDASPELELLLRRTKPFVLRRTKEEILKELPPKTETDIYLELTEKQKALYRKTIEQVRTTIDDAYRTKTQAQAQIIALTALLKLRQLCIAPQLLAPEMEDTSPKIQFLLESLQELHAEGHSALVFSQFTSFLDLLERDMKHKDIKFLRLDGSTQVKKRKELVERFQDGTGPSVFLLSLKAGGQGLNLTRASYVFHLDPWWNPAVENQASDRAHRIGQTNKVSITRILMRHTIEEKMMALKKKKLELYRAVMEEPTAGSKGLKMTKSDFNFLLG